MTLVRGSNLQISPPATAPDRLLISMTLAVRDLGDKPLRNVTVEIKYPAGYSLVPQGSQTIDPENRTVIYEHPVSDLKVSGGAAFLPVGKTDKLAFRADILENFSVVFTADDVPEDLYYRIVTYIGSHRIDGAHLPTLPIDLQVRVFADGRPVTQRQLSITVPGSIQYGFQTANRPLANWKARFEPYRALISGPQAWQLRGQVQHGTGGSTREVEYRAGRLGRAHFQVIGVDGRPRRIIVDENGDGQRDVEFVDQNGDSTFDAGGSYTSDVGLYPWTSKMLR